MQLKLVKRSAVTADGAECSYTLQLMERRVVLAGGTARNFIW